MRSELLKTVNLTADEKDLPVDDGITANEEQRAIDKD
jgi:hypothetical protein